MFFWVRFVEGLLFAHALLLASYVAGASILWVRERAASSAQAMMRVVCTCAAGISAYGFLLFIIALAKLFYPPFLAAAFLLLVFGGPLLYRQSPTSLSSWRTRFDDLVRCWDIPFKVLWVLMVILAAPSVLQPIGGDPVHYHLIYAEEWARSGALIVDPFLRFPFYASNFTLFFSALFAAHGEKLADFVMWPTALVTALGICATVRVYLQKTIGYWWAAACGVAATLSVVGSATYLRWLPTAYMDIAIGMFALACMMCALLAFVEADRRWLPVLAIVTGFFIGMKASFLILVPVLGLALLMTAISLRADRRSILALLSLLALAAAPWYARNLILAGDPVPPVGNIAFYGDDGLMTKGEWDGIQQDLRTPASLKRLVTLPVRAFTNTQFYTGDFRDAGITALILLLFLPAALVLAQWLLIGGYNAPSGVSALIVTGLIGYWFMSATHFRYALVFFPSLAVCVAVVLSQYFRGRFGGVAALALFLVLMIPSSSSIQFYRDTYNRERDLPTVTSEQEYLRRFVGGYAEQEFTTKILRENGIHGRVYIFGALSELNADYYFRRNGISSIGDWAGPAGYFRLTSAIDTYQAAQFLDDLGVVAVEVPGKGLGGLGVPLKRQLLARGFCPVTLPGGQSLLLVRYGGKCKSLLRPGELSVVAK